MPQPRLLVAASCLLLSACGGPRPPSIDEAFTPLPRLSDYHLFSGNGATQEPAPGVLPYDVNTPLFSDYTAKYRFVFVPPGRSASYRGDGAFDFPDGTILVKTFAALSDLSDPSKGRRLLETRLLIKKPSGWLALPYVWDEAQTEATLREVGGEVALSWRHTDGSTRSVGYVIPNVNQCKGCHEDKDRVLAPIGPKAANLNRPYAYASGEENQLSRWSREGLLAGAPAPEAAPRLAVWSDPKSGSLDARARAWLDVNCAHCHSPAGPARSSGLDLRAAQAEPVKLGVMKTPVAAGRGSGGRSYDIVPGRPDESILVYRIESTDPGVMMPELPRKLVDEEGAALIRSWIAAMPPAP